MAQRSTKELRDSTYVKWCMHANVNNIILLHSPCRLHIYMTHASELRRMSFKKQHGHQPCCHAHMHVIAPLYMHHHILHQNTPARGKKNRPRISKIVNKYIYIYLYNLKHPAKKSSQTRPADACTCTPASSEERDEQFAYHAACWVFGKTLIDLLAAKHNSYIV